MTVTIRDRAGNTLQEWELMDTFESGNWSTILNYVNETENINATFVLFHPNVVSELAENVNVVHEYLNTQLDEMPTIFSYLVQSSNYTLTNWVAPNASGTGGIYSNEIVFALSFILIGIISIVVRFREKTSGIVMFIKSFNSFYSLLFGLLWILSGIPTPPSQKKDWRPILPYMVETIAAAAVFHKVTRVE